MKQSIAMGEAASGVELQPAGAEAAPPAARSAAPRKQRLEVAGTLLSLASTVVIAVFVITFLVQAFEIPSPSMEDTLKVGDYLLVDKVHYADGGRWGHLLPYTDIHRGDIVVFRFPVHPSQHFVKRVIGLPGDRIRLIDKRVYVNGKPLEEPYVRHVRRDVDVFRDYFPNFGASSADVNPRWWVEMHNHIERGELVVPSGEYFVLGDNREDSEDSRYWGFVPRQNMVGQPLLIYWSIGRAEESASGDKLASSLVSSALRLFTDVRWQRALRRVK